jgi:hypothetical protein
MFTQAFADYQPPQQNRGENMSVQQASQQPHPPEVPQSIGVAMAFIQHACMAKVPRGFTKHNDCSMYDEVIQVELLAKHEAAFNQACNLMGVFFDSEMERMRRQGALEEAVFLKNHGVLLDSMHSAFCGDDPRDASDEQSDTVSHDSPGGGQVGQDSTEAQDVHGYE